MELSWRRVLLGRPLATSQASHERLPKRLALPILSSDALSSTAYATEEILRVLLVAGAAKLSLSIPISLCIAGLLAIVALSYRQTIFAYPNGGGAYIVAKENLGSTAGLIAAASLLIDYILTVSVSVAAGVASLISAFPKLQPLVVWICLGIVILLTIVNLRGLKESGALFAFPTYFFIAIMFGLVGWGLFRIFILREPAVGETALAKHAVDITLKEQGLQSIAPLSLFLLLRAFSSGCTAMSGVEAISNAIPAFKKPESKNAATTLVLMAVILITLFVGITFISNHFGITALPEAKPGQVSEIPFETVISQVSRQVFGNGDRNFLYYATTLLTTLILTLAANTAYAGFPLLASLLAKDRYLPRQLSDLGDKLVFNNGILVLAGFASVLLVLFNGSVTSLIPLYAVGVFTSFTLSQLGMVNHWLKERGKGWQASMVVNGVGSFATGIVLIVIAATKFNAGDPTGVRLPFGSENGTAGTSLNYGAWIVIVLTPLLVILFSRINSHYKRVSRHFQQQNFDRLKISEQLNHTVLVLVPGLNSGIFPAIRYARSLSLDARAVHIEMDPEKTPALKEDWEQHADAMPLVILESPFRTLQGPLVEYVNEVSDERDDDELTIIIPELVTAKGFWQRLWHRFLHNSSANSIRRALSEKDGVIITSYRYFADEEPPIHAEATAPI